MVCIGFCFVMCCKATVPPPKCLVAIAPDHALFSRPSAFVATGFTGFVVQLVSGRAQLRYRFGFAMLTKKGVVGSYGFVNCSGRRFRLPSQTKPAPTFRGGLVSCLWQEGNNLEIKKRGVYPLGLDGLNQMKAPPAFLLLEFLKVDYA